MNTADERGVLVFVDSDYADTPYDKWAADAGIQPYLLVNSGRYSQYAHMAGARAFDGYATSGAVERAALEAAHPVPPAAVVARSEGDVLRAARLRELLGVPGQDWRSAIAFRDKVLMKSLLRERGVLVPEFAPVRIPMDLFGFVREHGYPVVVKPAFGSGSTGTHVLRGPGDLAALFEAGLPEHAEVERFVEGTMYVVDGLVHGGAVPAVFVSRYLNDCLSFRAGSHLGSVQLTRDDPLVPRLIAYARRVLDRLPTPDCTTFHLEVFHTPGDELVLCEVASRTGGALTTAAIRSATGFDLDKEWFLAQVSPVPHPVREVSGAAPGRTQPTAGWVVFYPEAGTLAALPQSPPPFVAEQRQRGRIGTTYGGGEKSGVYLAGYVVTGADAAEVEHRVGELAEWYAAGVRWES
ncbi:ATP-dependent carboxylate-amine ligase [Streptomyces sp. TRM49041]|uniref:ATP-grasp domain-containing protein n=1 Tax=Streptomyces sp. TRM49041 TaxID=2603216 RepID=UPI0011EE3E39|nr:ATP-dependent carboxylate-amine ligase [Streptomyces sp. TRM49041]